MPETLSRSLTLDITIRECTREDLPKLEWHGMFTAHRVIFRREFARHQRGTNLMLVADMRGYPIGQVWIDFACQKKRGAGMVWALRVMPWLQNQGLGASLMQAAEAAIKARGLARVTLEVERRNTHARRFYERLGYRSAGWRNGVDSYEWNGRTINRRVRLELMIKDLVSAGVGAGAEAEVAAPRIAPAGRACVLAAS